ncbi:MAG: acetylxylan esterase [candidate division WS1 bacterium]|jgi:dienelactone hydrolase|nr:acetylxylan esterase [candidate division WS1 bacterium]
MNLFDWLCDEATAISAKAMVMPPSADQLRWSEDERRVRWLESIGLWPLPERTPLHAEVTGTFEREDYVVENVHFQSAPGAHVPGNIYRPKEITEPLPAVLYLCGHSEGKIRLGYQQNPRWFGAHGYIALVLDPIQLGESQGFHHGTFHLGRWDWFSRGYNPAGAEVWNAMRALDYLETREDVDAGRMGVTGLSGGGVISWDLAAADKRIKCCAPVCQTGSQEELICDRAIDGHCDCAHLVNYYQIDTAYLGALIAPRPLLVSAGADDALWRPYAYKDQVHRVRRIYESMGVADKCQLVEDLSFHGYTPVLRKAIFEWFNLHLKGDDTPVEDDVTDFCESVENLQVFGGKLPENDTMGVIETLLIPPAKPIEVRSEDQWRAHQEDAIKRLRALSFRNVPDPVRPKVVFARDAGGHGGLVSYRFDFDPGDGFEIRGHLNVEKLGKRPQPALVTAMRDARSPYVGGGANKPSVPLPTITGVVEVRGTGCTSYGEGLAWTLRRGVVNCGYTIPGLQTFDLLAGLAVFRAQEAVKQTAVYGVGDTCVHAIYAAILDPEVSEVVLEAPPASHEDPETPEILGVLRVGDLPQNLALVFPRPITFVGEIPEAYQWTVDVYERFGMQERIRVIEKVGEWEPFGG